MKDALHNCMKGNTRSTACAVNDATHVWLRGAPSMMRQPEGPPSDPAPFRCVGESGFCMCEGERKGLREREVEKRNRCSIHREAKGKATRTRAWKGLLKDQMYILPYSQQQRRQDGNRIRDRVEAPPPMSQSSRRVHKYHVSLDLDR